jgi:hypothetical protein
MFYQLQDAEKYVVVTIEQVTDFPGMDCDRPKTES